MSKIDSHVHFWELARGDYFWLKDEMQAIYQDFGATDFVPLRIANDISEIILVQAAPTFAETQYIMELAEHCHFVSGVIGKVDIEQGKVAQKQLDELAMKPLFRGIRPMLKDMGQNRWLELAGLDEIVKQLVELDLSFECMVLPNEMNELLLWLDKHPELRAVLSHGGMPDISASEFRFWADNISQIASNSQIYCKLSGLTTLADVSWNIQTVRPYVEHLLLCFGYERLIWGSDWPVMLCAGSYSAWCDVCDELMHGLPQGQKRSIYSDNAKQFYKLSGSTRINDL